MIITVDSSAGFVTLQGENFMSWWSLDMFFELLRNKCKGQTKECFAWIIEMNMSKVFQKNVWPWTPGLVHVHEDSRPFQEGFFTPISQVMCAEIRDPGYTVLEKIATPTDNSKHFCFFVDAPPSLLHLAEAGCALHLPRWFYRKVFASEQLHRGGLIVRQNTRMIYNEC